MDPELLRADINLSKERVERLKRELSQITSEISYTQRGVDKLFSVEQKFNARENGCFRIEEVVEIKDQIMNIQKSLVNGEKEKNDLKNCLVQLKSDLTKLHMCEESPDASAFNLAQDRICVASQTDLCSDIFPVGARLAEMAKMKLQYDEWKKRIKQLQQQLADHVDKIEPGQLESDKDRLLLIQEKEQYLKELRSLSSKSRSTEEMEDIKTRCTQLENDLRDAFKTSNQCIADRLRIQEEKEHLLTQLQEALRSTQLLEDRIKSISSGSTFSISSGSSVGSQSTASSKNSLIGLSFTDIYGDPLAADNTVDVTDLNRRMRLLNPSEASISARSSLTNDSGSSRKSIESIRYGEPMYENTRNYPLQHAIYPNALDCLELEKRLSDLDSKQIMTQIPLSTIYERASFGVAQGGGLSNPSSTSNSAVDSNESVAGDSGVFEASRALAANKDAAQVQLRLRYSKQDLTLHISIERARNLNALGMPNHSQIYFKAALLPGTVQQTFRSKMVADLRKPVFNDSFQIAINLNKIFTKTLQINLMSVTLQREECVGCAQVSLAEFNVDDITQKWYNILSFRLIQHLDQMEVSGACKEESSDESTIISSQTSTLTRNQGQDEMQLVNEMNLLNVTDGLGGQQAGCTAEDEDVDDSSTEDEDRQRTTEEMIAAYMNQVQNYVPSCADKETNTECAFLPEKSRIRNFERPSTSKYEEDDRPVKRSQTFSPRYDFSCRKYCFRKDSFLTMYVFCFF